ncbi:hypothetical protein [Rhizobium sp. SL42]|uniref:hypothetical protein n=1 Tax=Rhizobium sp. SL42 TaxID=2806346 RepID=UPI001F268EE5|nr:hypothetical protein [Rhizobium sp. SL42]UJW77329.1 hypothetical protein IM739_19865 [Rhizobium sp. SL42]
MNWHPIEALEPGRLAVLFFLDEAAPRCVGYIERDGLCGWPANVSGRRPQGWLDLSAMLEGMPEMARRFASSA